MTVDEVKAEVRLLNLENIRHYPCTRSNMEDFYSMYNKYGVEAAQTIMIPPVFNGDLPRPSEFFGRK